MTIVVTETSERPPSSALDIITRALRTIGVLGSGETAGPAMASDGLSSLNEMVEAWDTEKLSIFEDTQEGFTLTGAQSYTIGSGGDFDTSRPMKITSAFVRVGTVDYPVDVVTKEQYDGISLKSTAGEIPSVVCVEMDYPLSTLKLWPVATGCTLYLNSVKPLSIFTSLTTQVNFPPGYERALRLCLAVEMMPEYGMDNPMVIRQAIDAKAWIKRANHRPRVMGMPAGIPLQGGYDIRRGY
jgi:hypothetical protein